VALKEILYEMRFDEVSAVYSDFGPFIMGLLAEPAEAVRRAGL
jgi:chlorite dismutase